MNMPRSLILSLCTASLAMAQAAGPDVAADPLAAELDAAFARAMPPPDEARWTLIPWRRSLTDALAEAKVTGKPVYLFVNDGNVDDGRC